MNAILKTCALAVVLVSGAAVAPAQTFTTLVNFDGTNGGGPSRGPLIQASNGDLYCTTSLGGAYKSGAIFKITPTGKMTTLYSFNSTDGANPEAGLIEATNGYLYGTAYQGAFQNNGTIFMMTSQGAVTTLYSFGGVVDGSGPVGGLIQAANGELYGTTDGGGSPIGQGTIFKITPAGAFTNLHIFNGGDGFQPFDGLVQAADGNLYGTTFAGGVNDNGTVFKISPTGSFTSLHSFDSTDGGFPVAGLVQANDGNMYGTTYKGGANKGGTIFRLSPAGVLTSIYSFNSADGYNPEGELIQATDGNLYGTTQAGGLFGYGTIFRFSSAGLTTLHNFDSTDGAHPYGTLVQATDGDLYGTTKEGGINGYGTIYKLSLGLSPFVKTLPTVGPVGSTVKILGSDLTGATSVTFNGTPATILSDAPTVIYAKVPAGATTGKVQVVTPSGTLVSNVSFVVP